MYRAYSIPPIRPDITSTHRMACSSPFFCQKSGEPPLSDQPHGQQETAAFLSEPAGASLLQVGASASQPHQWAWVTHHPVSQLCACNASTWKTDDLISIIHFPHKSIRCGLETMTRSLFQSYAPIQWEWVNHFCSNRLKCVSPTLLGFGNRCRRSFYIICTNKSFPFNFGSLHKLAANQNNCYELALLRCCCVSNSSPLQGLNSCWNADLRSEICSFFFFLRKGMLYMVRSPASLATADERNRISSGKENTPVEAHQRLFPVTQRCRLARHERHNSCSLGSFPN